MTKDYTLKPIKFKEANTKFIGDKCGDLPILNDGKSLLSIWKAPLIARIKFLFSGKINVCIIGQKLPPLWLSIGNQFKNPKQ